jgi:hypothetical protein
LWDGGCKSLREEDMRGGGGGCTKARERGAAAQGGGD